MLPLVVVPVVGALMVRSIAKKVVESLDEKNAKES